MSQLLFSHTELVNTANEDSSQCLLIVPTAPNAADFDHDSKILSTPSLKDNTEGVDSKGLPNVQEMMNEVGVLVRKHCWGCSDQDPYVQRYGSAHQGGCAENSATIMDNHFENAMCLAYFKKNVGKEPKEFQELKTAVMNKWDAVYFSTRSTQ